MSRTKQIRADTDKLKQLVTNDLMQDNRTFIAVVMRLSGCTFTEVGEVIGLSRQQAELIVRTAL